MNKIAQSLIAYQKGPKAKALTKHLQSKAWREAPKGDPVKTALAQVSDLLKHLKKLPELEELLHCVELGRRTYDHTLDWNFLGSVLYFDVPDPETHETLGSICLDLGRATEMHPQRFQALEMMCHSRLGFYVHEGGTSPRLVLRDLWTNQVEKIASNYAGAAGQLWMVRLLDGALAEKPRVIQQPNLVLWRDFARHHSDPMFLKHPLVWDQWLEFATKGFGEETDDAIFLKAEPEVREAVASGTFSFAQRWSPAVIQESRDETPRRPRLLALADEETGQIAAFDQQMDLQSAAQVLQWIRSQPVQPKVLWLDDSSLYAYLSEHWMEGRCELRSALPAVDQALKGLTLRLESAGPGISDTLPEREALAFFEEARRFFDKAPWQQISCEDVLIFQFGEEPPWGAVVMGSGAQEYGLALFEDPELALAMINGEPVLPKVGFSLSEEWLLPAKDLQFLDRHGFHFPDQTYPWLVHQPPESLPISPDLCRRVQWLLTWVPELAATGEPVQRPEGVLARMDVEEGESQALAMLIPLFLGAWGKRTQVAEVLAQLFCDFLSYLVTEHGITPQQMEDALEALVPIGDQYLRLHGRKRTFVLEFFLNPGQDKLRKRLARFLEERF